MGQAGSIRRHLATTHQCFIFLAIKISRTCGLAFIVFYFLQKNNSRRPFCAKTPASRFGQGIDFASVCRKSFTRQSRDSGDVRAQYEDLKVRELFTNSSAMSLNSGSGAITGSKLMR